MLQRKHKTFKMEVVVMSKVHARCFVVLLLSVFTCGILEWRGDTAEDLLREIPELVSQLRHRSVTSWFRQGTIFAINWNRVSEHHCLVVTQGAFHVRPTPKVRRSLSFRTPGIFRERELLRI